MLHNGYQVFEYDHRMCIWGGFTERVPLVSKNIIVKYYDYHYIYVLKIIRYESVRTNSLF